MRLCACGVKLFYDDELRRGSCSSCRRKTKETTMNPQHQDETRER